MLKKQKMLKNHALVGFVDNFAHIKKELFLKGFRYVKSFFCKE